MSFGLTPQGFNLKPLETILEEIENDQRASFGTDFDVSPTTPQGQINGVFADKLASLWEALQAVYASRTRAGAEGAALDDIGAINNLPRLAEQKSEVTLSVPLDAGFTLPIGTVFSIGLNGSRWVTTEDVTATNADYYPVSAESELFGPFIGNAYSIDTVISSASGLEERATLYSANVGPYALRNYEELIIDLDDTGPQIVTFLEADFGNIAAATAQEVLDVIKAAIPGLDGDVSEGNIKLFTNVVGSGGSIQVVGGQANASLGFNLSLSDGFNPNLSAMIRGQNSEPYDMSAIATLFVEENQNTAQPIAFTPDDFATKAQGRILAVPGALLADNDTFTIFDSSTTSVLFVFDNNASITAFPTQVPIPFIGTESAQQIRDLIVAAINNSILNVTAVATGEAEEIIITHNAIGVIGNIPMINGVTNSDFVTEGLSGGSPSNASTATAVQVARVINDQASGFKAYSNGGRVQLETTPAVGFNSRLEVTGGDAATIFGLQIENQVAGSNGAAQVGRSDELDAAYRLRQEIIDSAGGNATYDAMRSKLLQTEGVIQAFVFDNTTDFVDAAGRPAHSFEAVVLGGDDTEVAQVILETKPLAIQAYGVPGPSGVQTTLVNSQGSNIPIGFSRPDIQTVFVEVDINVNQTFGNGVQVNGEQTVRQAIKDVGDAYNIGQDLIALVLRCAPLNVTGVTDVTDIKIDTVNPPINTQNILISERSIAFFSTLNIVVNTTYI